ncbi:MAG: dockerin type I domain-containing protein, partial [Firmicutes bacterium]|nr:dockerin type I domain-containing protein [Bacillota bacterium]
MKKKFLGILLSLSLIVSLVPASVFADDSLRGDLNGDGKVDTKDVDLLQQYLEGDADLNDMQKKVADMDDNDVIDINDLTALQEQLKLAIFNVNVEYGHASVARNEVNKAAYNTKVTITAEAPSPGMKFIRWEVEHNSVSLADAFSATTSFVMPDKDVKIAAV